MSKKAKLSQLNKEMNFTPTITGEKIVTHQNTAKEANPIRGERGDFLKVTITISPEMFADLKRLGLERKLQGKKDNDVSSLIRESLTKFMVSPETS